MSAAILPSETLSGRVQQRLVEFVRLARGNGFPVGVAEEVDAQRIALCCGLAQAERLRWGLRSLLCSRQDDWQRFDALFDSYWLPGNTKSRVQAAGTAGRGLQAQAGAHSGAAQAPDLAGDDSGGDAGQNAARGGASMCEVLQQADFHALADAGQMRAMERMAESLARRMRRRLLRRERIQRTGRRINLRRTLRNSLPLGGIPLRPAFRARRKRQPRLLLVADVSRSMAMYSFVFLRFARGLVSAFRDADAFACHTRLVHITDALRQPDTTRVLQSLALISRGWAGGTRLGDSLAAFNRDYGRLLNRRTVFIVVSDGLDTGEPTELADQLATIRARVRRVIWLNPLLGRDGYEPKTAAMLAALPHLDLFAPAHNLSSLAALEPVLAEL